MNVIQKFLVCAAMLAMNGCASIMREVHEPYDKVYAHHINIHSMIRGIIESKVISKGDKIVLVPLRGNDSFPGSLIEDAVVTAFNQSGVNLIRLSEKNSFSIEKTDSFDEEKKLYDRLQDISKLGARKVVLYRWVDHQDFVTASISEAKNWTNYTQTKTFVTNPIDRAYFRVIDTATGVVIWANLVGTFGDR